MQATPVAESVTRPSSDLGVAVRHALAFRSGRCCRAVARANASDRSGHTARSSATRVTGTSDRAASPPLVSSATVDGPAVGTRRLALVRAPRRGVGSRRSRVRRARPVLLSTRRRIDSERTEDAALRLLRSIVRRRGHVVSRHGSPARRDARSRRARGWVRRALRRSTDRRRVHTQGADTWTSAPGVRTRRASAALKRRRHAVPDPSRRGLPRSRSVDHFRRATS